MFNPVNPELGTIPSMTIYISKYRILNLSNPDQEANAIKIYQANYFISLVINLKELFSYIFLFDLKKSY